MHILSVYIFEVGINQQLYDRACACWCWMQGLYAGAECKVCTLVLLWNWAW